MFRVATGRCFVCGQWFSFNAAHVPSFPFEGSREPICKACVEAVNPARIKLGLPPIVPHPDAYKPEDLG